MKDNRQNLDLYFLGYKRASRTKYLIPLVFALAFGGAGLLIYMKIVPNMLPEVYSFVLFGMGGTLALITVLGFLFGKDRTKIPTTIQVNGFLAEDVEQVKATMHSQLAPDFSAGDKREYVVINHCHSDIDGFRPYYKKDESNVLHCSLNKITIFTFAPRRLQIFTAVVDMFTGIEIRQNSLKIPYSNIYDCYIAYNSYLKPESVKYETQDRKHKESHLPPRLIQAVKVCKEVLRVKTRLQDDYDQNPVQDSHDILVADFEIYHTANGVYKNIYTINDGKAIEKEILRRIGHTYIADDENLALEDKAANDFHFVDDFQENKPRQIIWS